MVREESIQLKADEAKERLGLAKTFLRLAKKHTKKKEDYRGAVDLGYNSSEHCLKSFILLKQDTIPRRHSGIVQRFSELYIKEEEIEEDMGQRLRDALKFRNLARYEPKATIGETMVNHILILAKELINRLEEKLVSSSS